MTATILLLPNAKADAATFYLSAKTGDDKNDGRTPERAWRSLRRVNSCKLGQGDQIVLAEGETFAGSLLLEAEDSGTPANPIVIRSAGKHPATILSPDNTAISCAAGGIEIRNLILKGNATAAKKGHNGIAFFVPGTKGERYPYIRLDRLAIRGFGDAGISIGSDDANQAGYEDVQITHVQIHEVYGTGIISFDKGGDRKNGYAHRDILVRDCDVSQNHGGSGIILSGIERGLVEYCRAADNAGGGGGVGMWAYATKGVRFRYCIASGTRTQGKDGGGFDLDGACLNCVIENCLSFDNDGPGYMHCDYPTAGRTEGNQIRTSISINDGRYPEKQNPFGFGFVTWGSGLDNCHISGNLALITRDRPHKDTGGALFISYLPGSQVQSDILHVQGCTATNNVVVVSDSGTALVMSDLPKATPENARFTGNTYVTNGKATPLFVWNDQHYSSLTSWQAATNQETGTSLQNKNMAPPEVPEAVYALKDPRALPKFILMQWLAKRSNKK